MLSNRFSRAAAVAITLSGTAVNAFWRLECDGSIALARIDPLMDFDGLSDHVHILKGGSGKFNHSEELPVLHFACPVLVLVGGHSWSGKPNRGLLFLLVKVDANAASLLNPQSHLTHGMKSQMNTDSFF